MYTDYAHPAWFRGEEYGVIRVTDIIKDILYGKTTIPIGSSILKPVTEKLIEIVNFRMLMNWICPKEKLPPQGKKILAFYEGDCVVAQRIGEYWFSIPFIESKYARIDEPTFWADIEMPIGYSGKILMEIDGKMMDLDEASKIHNNVFKEIQAAMLKSFTASR